MDRLYYSNPYIKEWNTEVKEVIEREGKVYVVLNETAFYPEGGGQPSDRGYIDDIEVLHVLEEDKTIYHQLKQKPVNKIVSCRLDMTRRFDHMQQHTGQHLLSSIFYNLYQGETSSFHLGEDYVSIDISLENISEEMISSVEKEANSLIFSNLEVKTYIILKNELEKLPLRKLPKVEEDIRIVEIDKLDYSPCCGTHVLSTGSIGIIKILKTEKYKGVTRVYFKCGNRALLDYQDKHKTLIGLSRILAVDIKEIAERINNNELQIKNITRENKELKEKISSFEAEKLLAGEVSGIITKIYKEKNFDEVQLLAKKLLESGASFVILASLVDLKIYIAQSGSSSINCGKILKDSLSEFNGRGGGGDKQAQASFKNENELERYISYLEIRVRE